MEWGLTIFDERLDAYRLKHYVSVEEAERELLALSPDYIPKSVSRLARITGQGDADQVSDYTAIHRYEQTLITSVTPGREKLLKLNLKKLGDREKVYLPKTFGQYLERIRRKAGLTQTGATRLTGLPHSSLAKFEIGDSTPTISTILRLVPLTQKAGLSAIDLRREYGVLKLGPEEGTLGDILSRERWFAQMSIKELSHETGLATSFIRDLEKSKADMVWTLSLSLNSLAWALKSARLMTLAKEIQHDKSL